MKRSIVTLSLVGSVSFLLAAACNQAVTPEDDESGSSGSGNSSAGTGTLLPMAGNANSAAGSAGLIPTAGTGTGGQPTAGASSGGMSGTAAGGASAGTSTGGAAAGSGGGPGDGNPGCPVKIDSKVACTQVITCQSAYCGVFQLGSKNCECAAASGMFTCTSCTYAGKTEEILVKPEAALPACASDDATLEDTPGCTKGMRCHSLTADKNRFCACWEDPLDASLKWDCDTQPSDWPL
jgi:hypothetical protein